MLVELNQAALENALEDALSLIPAMALEMEAPWRGSATGTSPTIGVRVPDELTEKIDNWRSEQRPIPSRPEAIRQLVELALKAKVHPQ
jgi:hypothetical protein